MQDAVTPSHVPDVQKKRPIDLIFEMSWLGSWDFVIQRKGRIVTSRKPWHEISAIVAKTVEIWLGKKEHLDGGIGGWRSVGICGEFVVMARDGQIRNQMYVDHGYRVKGRFK